MIALGDFICMAVNYMEDGTLAEPAPINAFMQGKLADAAAKGQGKPVSQVRFRPPLPRQTAELQPPPVCCFVKEIASAQKGRVFASERRCGDPLSELASSELLSLTNVDSGIENAHEQHPHEGAVQQSKR
jgi:hypothetical protein